MSRHTSSVRHSLEQQIADLRRKNLDIMTRCEEQQKEIDELRHGKTPERRITNRVNLTIALRMGQSRSRRVFVLDTGARINLIKAAAAVVLPTRARINRFYGIDNREVVSTREANLTVGNREHILAIVPDSFPIEEDGLLGMPFLEREEAKIDTKNRTIELTGTMYRVSYLQIPEKTLKTNGNEILEELKSKLDEKENELHEVNQKLGKLQKLTGEYQEEKEKLLTELSSCKVYCKELKSEQDAQKIIFEDEKKEAQRTIEKQQGIIQTLDEELNNMRAALMNKDRVCENYSIKIQEYSTWMDKVKETAHVQDQEIKTLKKEKVQNIAELNRLNEELENKNTELLEVYSELKSCESTISDLRNKLQVDGSNSELLRQEKCVLIKNIVNYKNSVEKLQEDRTYIKNNVTEHFAQVNNELSDLKNVLTTYLEQNSAIRNDEIESVQTKIQELEDFKQKNDKLHSELRDTLSFKYSLEVDLGTCKEQLKEMSLVRERRNELELKNSELTTKIDELRSQLEHFKDLSEDLQSLKRKYESLHEEFKQVNSTNELLSNEVVNLKQHLQRAVNDTKELEDVKQNCSQTYRLLHERFNRDISERNRWFKRRSKY